MEAVITVMFISLFAYLVGVFAVSKKVNYENIWGVLLFGGLIVFVVSVLVLLGTIAWTIVSSLL